MPEIPQLQTFLGCGLLPRFLRRVVFYTFESKLFAMEISNLEPSSDEICEITGGQEFDSLEHNFPFYKTTFVVVVFEF
jgi:hypothetical protein